MNRYESDDRRDDDASFGDQAERFSRKLSDSAQQVWLAGLGALGRAQAEGSRFFDGLVKEGEAWESCRRERQGDQGPGWRDNVESSLDDAREKASGTWNKVEKAFDDQVQGAQAPACAHRRRSDRAGSPHQCPACAPGQAGDPGRFGQRRARARQPPVAGQRALTTIVAMQ